MEGGTDRKLSSANTQASAEEWRQALGLTNCLLGLSEGGLRHSPKGRLIASVGGGSYGK